MLDHAVPSSSFNPLRPLLAGESPTLHTGRGIHCRFNPLRPLLAGESQLWISTYPSASCFNPLRPLLAGESQIERSCCASGMFQSTPAIAGRRIPAVEWMTEACELVSIHSGHCWPENRPASAGLFALRNGFQSTPAIAGRRIGCQLG